MNYLTEHTWMQALGWTLLHSLWQASLIALIWAISRHFLKLSSAQKRYLAAMGAIFTLLLCSALTFWQLVPEYTERSLPAPSGIEAMSLPTLDDIPAALLSVEASESWTDFFDSIAPWLSLLWILGAVIMGIRFSGGLWYVHRLRHTAITPLDDQWQKRANAIAKKLGLTRAWQLMESELVTQPLTLGHFKPLVLIPVGMLSGLSPEQVEAILAHEFAHIRRADFLFNLIQSLIEILFFYHPAVWWLSREIRKERELCCDDMAVAAMGDAFTYAEALTRLQLFRHSPQHFLTMQAKGKSGSFTARIHRLFAPSPSGPSLWKSFSAALLLSMAILGSGFYAYTQSHDYLEASTKKKVENTDPGADFILFNSNSIKELNALLEDLKAKYNIELEILDYKKNNEDKFQMISLSYFNPEKQKKIGYKVRNFTGLAFDIDPKRANPLQLGFAGKGNEETVMETFDLEAPQETFPKNSGLGTSIEEVTSSSIIAEYILRPSSSTYAFNEIKKDLRKYSNNEFYITRGENGKIQEFFFISEYEGKSSKSGFRDFEELHILIKPDINEEPKIHLLDEKGVAFWTDEISTNQISVSFSTKRETIKAWLSERKADIKLDKYIADTDGKLVEVVINENGNIINAKVPFQYQLVQDEEGAIISSRITETPPPPPTFAEKPIFIYLDGQGLGFYDVHINDVTKTLIKEGRFKGNSDIGEVILFTFGSRDLGSFLQEKRLPPPPPVDKSLQDGDYHVYVLYTWEHLAQQFEEEGPDKHRLYIFEGGNMGFEKGSIKEGIMNVCKDKKIDPKYVTAFQLNPNDAERRFGIKSVEVVEIRLKDSEEIEAMEYTIKEKPQKGLLEIKGNISIDSEKGPINIEGGAIKTQPVLGSLSAGAENYYFFDGKPLGYRKGQIFSVIAQEVKARKLENIGGIVICDGEELNGKTYKTVQILSEEYEAEYYENAEKTNPLSLKVRGMSTKPEIWLDGEQISVESLQQLDPKVVATIDILKNEAAQDFSGNANSKEIIHLRTNRKASPVVAKKLSPKVKLEPATALTLKVSPNPSSETFNFDFELDSRTEIKFSIRDLQGKVIHKVPVATFEAGPQKIIWKAKKVANGVYIAQLETAEGIVSSQRVVLER
ncbi:MAG: M56 family metallopeptidase [Bacteroidota bacterium]